MILKIKRNENAFKRFSLFLKRIFTGIIELKSNQERMCCRQHDNHRSSHNQRFKISYIAAACFTFALLVGALVLTYIKQEFFWDNIILVAIPLSLIGAFFLTFTILAVVYTARNRHERIGPLVPSKNNYDPLASTDSLSEIPPLDKRSVPSRTSTVNVFDNANNNKVDKKTRESEDSDNVNFTTEVAKAISFSRGDGSRSRSDSVISSSNISSNLHPNMSSKKGSRYATTELVEEEDAMFMKDELYDNPDTKPDTKPDIKPVTADDILRLTLSNANKNNNKNNNKNDNNNKKSKSQSSAPSKDVLHRSDSGELSFDELSSGVTVDFTQTPRT